MAARVLADARLAGARGRPRREVFVQNLARKLCDEVDRCAVELENLLAARVRLT